MTEKRKSAFIWQVNQQRFLWK